MAVGLVLLLSVTGGVNASIAGVTIDSFYSENVTLGRLAVNIVDGSALHVNGPGTHGSWPAGAMWLNSDATAASPQDVDDQWLIFDLGGVYDLASMEIWNYNEYCHWAVPGGPYEPFWAQRRGVYEMEVLVSADKATWSSLGLKYLTAAPGVDTVPFGEIVPLDAMGVRYVKFDINTNQCASGVWTCDDSPPSIGTDNYVGLSEVQFIEVPEPATLALLSMGCLALLRKRK